MVGYTPYKQAVEVPASGKALGKIAITQGVEVGDVVIEVQKPLVMADAEKTTYSVEDDPQASTSTLDEIIRKVPQLSLDGDGNVLLNGQSNYKILLNGRNSATMSNNFKDVIQSMPASQISRIEVITNPRPSTKPKAWRHHQPHHPTQEAVPRIQRQRRRERHGVGEPGLQRQRQPLDPGREVRGEHHGLCRLLRRGPYPRNRSRGRKITTRRTATTAVTPKTRAVRVTATSDWT
ncbi:MAG: TonB-dependent receptor plug domain-containing protein [Alistipes onderdonkii]